MFRWVLKGLAKFVTAVAWRNFFAPALTSVFSPPRGAWFVPRTFHFINRLKFFLGLFAMVDLLGNVCSFIFYASFGSIKLTMR